uniref:Uncharacterized protein n=1 Tax=Rhizophora mucronata TaxID=61149 RepID=A0A2P2PA32_RHIMU
MGYAIVPFKGGVFMIVLYLVAMK